MAVPRVDSHLSHSYTNSVYTFLSISGVRVGAAARNLPATSDKVVGSGKTSRASFMNHQKKKADGISSGKGVAK
jgi:hypothetical protein